MLPQLRRALDGRERRLEIMRNSGEEQIAHLKGRFRLGAGPLRILQQASAFILRAFALGDIAEVDRQAIGNGIGADIEPPCKPGSVLFERHLLLVIQRFVILPIRDGIYQSRKLLPHILAKQLLTGLCSEWPGLRIDVDVTPLRIEEHEPVRQIVQDARQTLPGGL